MLTQYIAAWAALTLSCWAATTLLPGVIIPNAKDALVIASLLGVISDLLGYLVVVLFGADSPTLLALEIFILRSLVTGLLFIILEDRLGPRLVFASRLSALGCAVLMSGLGTTLQYLL